MRRRPTPAGPSEEGTCPAERGNKRPGRHAASRQLVVFLNAPREDCGPGPQQTLRLAFLLLLFFPPPPSNRAGIAGREGLGFETGL